MSGGRTTWRLATFNLQHVTKTLWLGKRAAIAGLLESLEADVLCLQEVGAGGLAWLRGRLRATAVAGVGRDDGAEAGEHVPILVTNPRWRLEESGTFWLSPTPDRPSRGWDAVHPRICTWARLRRGEGSGGDLVVANVHLDHRGRRAREASVRLLRERLARLAPEGPAVLCGDFNFRDRSGAYALLAGRSAAGGWIDAGASLGVREPTWDGWGFLPVGRARIDYVFVNRGLSVRHCEVLPNRVGDQRVSDHRPVLVEMAG